MPIASRAQFVATGRVISSLFTQKMQIIIGDSRVVFGSGRLLVVLLNFLSR
jgi:hypothetical protein